MLRRSPGPSPDAPPPPRRLRRFGRWLVRGDVPLLRRLLVAVLALAGTGTLLLTAWLLVLVPFTPGFGTLRQMKVQHPTRILAADGTELTRIQHLNREWVTLDEVAPEVVAALIATEDHRFYTHHGVDPIRLAASAVHTLLGDRQGGSTLTMQLARNLYPRRIGRASSINRKLKEIVTAFKIEATYTKAEILETYLNTVPFLYNAYGIERAAQTYFSKPAAALTLAESATLVGMLKATSTYNPLRHPDRARARRNVVLQQMVKRGVLDAATYDAVKDTPVQTRFARQPAPRSQAPHFTAYVRRQLEAWAEDAGYNLYTDGLVVHTTLDAALQRLAEAAVHRQGDALQAVADVEWSGRDNPIRSASPHDYPAVRRRVRPFAHFWATRTDVVDRFIRATPRYRNALATGLDPAAALQALRADRAFMDSLRTVKTRLEAGFVALDPRTGHVRAWVGSREYDRDQYDHVAQARRQPGSTFKPFVYAAALERGYRPDDRLRDEAVEIRVGREQVWRPVNAGGTVSGEALTLREALARSTNTIAARLIADVGARPTVRLARRMGIRQSPLEPVPSIALGTSPVTLLEMASAYATIGSGGVYRAPVIITRIEDAEGNVLATFAPEPERVLDEPIAHALLDMMRGVIDQGTGRRIRTVFGVRADVAGKTGTTQDNADGWFLMIHPHLVAGAWVGFNDPRVTFRSDYWGQGAHNALYVVGDVYRHALRQGRLDPRPTLTPAPALEPRTPLLARAGRWLRETLDGLRASLQTDAPPAESPAPPESAEPAEDTAPPRRWTQTPEPAEPVRPVEASPLPAEAERVLRGVGQVLGVLDEVIERHDPQAAERYRERLQRFARDAEDVLRRQEPPASPNARRRIDRSIDLDENTSLRDVLDQVARDLDPAQRREIERLLRTLERDLKRNR